MTDIEMILSCRPVQESGRVPIHIAPSVRKRLIDLLYMPEMHGVGYTAFVNRACELAETAIAEKRTREFEASKAMSA